MTASTPPLVEVIAEAIGEHEQELDQTACPTGYCVCNEKFASSEGHAAHQARAVLDALTKAGGVEWGVRWPFDTLGAKPLETVSCEAADMTVDALAKITPQGNPAPVAVSRLTLPWECAE